MELPPSRLCVDLFPIAPEELQAPGSRWSLATPAPLQGLLWPTSPGGPDTHIASTSGGMRPGRAGSWPHCPGAQPPTLVEPWSSQHMQPQRRASHSGSEKSAWRKMQVYHNEEATGTETPTGLLETGQAAQEQALCALEPGPQELSGNARGGLEAPERRRFSASELMTRLHSSLRLGRSTATRVLTSGSGAGAIREGKLPVRESRRAETRADSVSLPGPVDLNEVHGGLVEPRLDTQDKPTQDPSSATERRQSRFLLNCSVELSECLGTQDKQWLFSKLPEVKSTSERFLHDLEQRLEADVLRFSVCDVVLHHCPAFRRVYLPYVTNQAYQERTYQRLLLENPKFPGILARLEESPVCQRLPLTSFLILPFQRVTRLKMLVENILKRTAPGSQDEDMATKAFSALKELVQECNASVQSMKRTEELIHLSKKIHFEGKIFPLISQARWLVRHGELVELAPLPAAPPAKLKLSSKAVYLHLFNDCLLLSRRKELGKFAVFVHANMAELQVRDLSLKLQGIPGHVFLLRLLHGQRARHQLLLRARTESEKQRWISALRPSSPQEDKEITCDGEDRPQVQCVRTYKALQPDELTLEKTDILAVKTRTSDGWLEGVRLADGEKGWVPQAHVVEISSLSARLRNLREYKRVSNASSKLGDPPA